MPQVMAAAASSIQNFSVSQVSCAMTLPLLTLNTENAQCVGCGVIVPP